jgi:amino-acid N-acetyltransferase
MQTRNARRDDRAAIEALLRASALPVDDLAHAQIDFIVACDGGSLTGVGGLERHGDAALLRSLAVVPSSRGTGLGQALLRALEAHAAASGIRTLVLLTTTAAPFFAARGYSTIARADAPPAVQDSAEFRSLCPASATCMTKPIEATR